jgi:tripartite-type tricarboxylate transporter receptor subunit TctC
VIEVPFGEADTALIQACSAEPHPQLGNGLLLTMILPMVHDDLGAAMQTAATHKLPLVRDGSIKALAVTSDTRITAAPDAPTFVEMSLPALSYSDWAALFAPKGMPKNIIDKLNAAAVDALADQTVRSRLADLGQKIFPREQQTPEALGALQKADAEKWWPIIKEFGLKAERG